MERSVLLVRHGHVENPEGVLYGRLAGFNLSEKGKKQMKTLADRIRESGVVLKRIYTSPLERTVQSAQIIGDVLGVPIERDASLLEVECEIFEGKNFREQLKLYLRHGINVYSTYYLERGMETPVSTTQRMRIFLEEKLKETDGDFMIVSHGDPINFLVWSYVYKNHDFAKSSLFRRYKHYPRRGRAKVLVFDDNGNFIRLVGRSRFGGGQDLRTH